MVSNHAFWYFGAIALPRSSTIQPLSSTQVLVRFPMWLRRWTVSPTPTKTMTPSIRTLRQRTRTAALLTAGILFSASTTALTAQEAPKKEESKTPTAEQTVVLSPFEVSSSKNEGYVATSSLAGTRLNTELKDVASAIQIFTPKFLEDTGVTNVNQLLVYATNAEVSGQGGNYFGASAGNTSVINRLLVNPSSGTRLRGLDQADQTRDYFPTDVPLDSYNIDQIDIQRGPNAILYGLGSPAGIINYSLKVPSMQNNKYTADLRFGQYNKMRGSIDVDQTILPGVLGVRVDLLDQKQDYEQAFKYEKTKRESVVLRYTPKLADSVYTSFTAKYENGTIDSNHPRQAPPVDMLTNWFDPARLNKYVSSGPLNNGAPGAYGSYVTGGPQNNWWDSLGLIYGNPSSTTVGVPGVADAIRQRGGNPWSGWISPNNPNWNINGTHQFAQKSYFANNPNVMAAIAKYESATGKTFNGFGGWPDQEILNQSIFDYRTQTVEGPNSTQFNKFQTVNLNLAQTFLNGKVGYEVAYDHQEFNSGYNNIIGGQSVITIDINPWFRNGQPNPNLGRPFIVDSSDANIDQKIRNGLRATVFGKIDFKDITNKDNFLTQFLGSHTLTGLASDQKDSDFSRSFALYRYDSRYTANDNDDRVFGVHYLGPSLMNSTIAGGLHIQGLQTIQTPPSTVNAMVQGKGSVPDWAIIPVGILDQSSGLDNLYTGASAWQDETTTKSFIWQSRLLNDTIIGLFGWRDDNFFKLTKPQNVPTNAAGKAMPYAPSWSWDQGIAQGGAVRANAQKTNWSVMVHTPEFIKKHLPWGTEVSFGYAEAANFQPSQVSTDIYGMQNAAPAGKSREYNFIVSTLDNRVTLRVTHYKTTSANAIFTGTAPGGYDLAGVLARTMDGMMTETYLDGNTFDSAGNIIKVGRQNTTPEFIVNRWMFGDGNYSTAVANTPLPAGWTVQNHPELLTQPLRIRASAASTPAGSIDPATGNAYTEPPITPAEATYRRAWFAAQPDSEWYRPYGQALFKGLGFSRDPNRKWGFWPDSSPGTLAQTADTVSQGMEYEISANVTPNFRVMFDASKNTAVAANIMPQLQTFFADPKIQAFMNDGYNHTPAANYWGNNNNQTFSAWKEGTYVKYLTGLASAGRQVDELRKWHWNAVATYDFHQGALKGLTVGGSVRWSDKATIGYFPLYLPSADVWISDLNKPITAAAETNYDMWIGYKHKLSRKVDWKIQLNVRDLFAKKGLIPTQANPDGTIAQARIPAATSWEIANRFDF